MCAILFAELHLQIAYMFLGKVAQGLSCLQLKHVSTSKTTSELLSSHAIHAVLETDIHQTKDILSK
jgi:hypothetical protein